MKVLLVTYEDPGNPVGGLGVFIREYAQELKKKAEVRILLLRLKHDQVLDSTEPPKPPSDLVDYCIIYSRDYPTDHLEAKFLASSHQVYHLAQPILHDFKPDVIHCNDRQTWLPFRFYSNTVYSFHLSMPDLIGMRNLTDQWYMESKVEKDACNRAGALIVYSKYMRDIVWKSISNNSSPIVLPLGFTPDQYYCDKPTDRIVISFFGRLEQGQKGIYDFLQAVDLLCPENFERYKIEINVFGKGEVPQDLKSERITRTAFLNQSEKLKAYAESHIVVMPSKYEPFGLVGLEAIASGCVLLVTEGLGMDEYLIPGKNYVPIKSEPFDIKEKIELILLNPGQYLGRETAIKKTVSHWSWQRSVEEHLKIYHQVIAGRSAHLKAVFSMLSSRVLDWWRIAGAVRKSKMKDVFEFTKKNLPDGKTLVLGVAAEEKILYESTGKDIVFHSFVPDKDGHLHFQPEMMLIPAGCFDNIVFLYGLEFCTNIELATRELLRVAKEHLILSWCYGNLSFGQLAQFETLQSIESVLVKLPVEALWKQTFTLIDGFDHKKKEILVAGLKKTFPSGK